MDNIASWIWVLIPLAAIGIAPFKMWLRVKEKQIEAQTSLAAEKSAQYAQHVERIEQRLRVLEQIASAFGLSKKEAQQHFNAMCDLVLHEE